MENLKKDRTDKLLKDRGDNLKKNRQVKRENSKYESDRGDSVRNKQLERTSESDKKSEIRREVKHEAFKRQSDFYKEVTNLLDRRRRIRDKYTVKNYKQDNNKRNDKDFITSNKDNSINTQKHSETKDKTDIIKPTKTVKPTKVPVIRTITSKNDAKVYKAVTFTAPKQNTVTPLQINIPTATVNRTRIPELLNQNKIKTTSKTSVKHNSERKRASELKTKRRHKRHVSSPVFIKDGDSPLTEVAKWAPSCINKHTKPYYEAWVNTTLAARSKHSKNNKFVDDRNSIWTIRRALERIETPDLVNKDYKDERYTGKIKINHKWRQ